MHGSSASEQSPSGAHPLTRRLARETLAEVWEEISALADPLDPAFVEDFVRTTSPDSVPDPVVDRLVEESLKAPAVVWKETMRGLVEADLPVALGRITAPTLLMSGDEDVFAGGDQDLLLRGIPDAEPVVYEGVGHGVHLADPDRITHDLVAFLDRRASAANG